MLLNRRSTFNEDEKEIIGKGKTSEPFTNIEIMIFAFLHAFLRKYKLLITYLKQSVHSPCPVSREFQNVRRIYCFLRAGSAGTVYEKEIYERRVTFLLVASM